MHIEALYDYTTISNMTSFYFTPHFSNPVMVLSSLLVALAPEHSNQIKTHQEKVVTLLQSKIKGWLHIVKLQRGMTNYLPADVMEFDTLVQLHFLQRLKRLC